MRYEVLAGNSWKFRDKREEVLDQVIPFISTFDTTSDLRHNSIYPFGHGTFTLS
jgi:hypothetical protein